MKIGANDGYTKKTLDLLFLGVPFCKVVGMDCCNLLDDHDDSLDGEAMGSTDGENIGFKDGRKRWSDRWLIRLEMIIIDQYWYYQLPQ